jgi:hypothetical protein
LCNGDTLLARRRYTCSALALATLATALADVAIVTDARAQFSDLTPFTPSLTDPRRAQRFGTPDPTTRATASATPSVSAGETGFDSTGSVGKKKKKKKPKPGDPHPLPLPLPLPPSPGPPQQVGGHTSAQQIGERAPVADAYKPAGAPPQRPRPQLKDPYEPTGIHVGTLLLKPSVEVTRGYDTSPSHVPGGQPSPFTTVESAMNLKSEWSRHEYGLDLRGSYSTYDDNSTLNRPLLDVKSHTRIDVTRDTTINTESRFFLSTDYPGSPNLPVGFSKLPIFMTYGSTVGLIQRFNRLELSAKASADRTQYQDTLLLDGTSSSNQDRDFNQIGGTARAGYEMLPGVKPFVEVAADTRKHDLQFDRDGLQRDSHALTPRIGTTFDVATKLKGEISVGYTMRKFVDPTLPDLKGVVADASLIWNATGLTTATLTVKSTADETVLPGVSGVLRRDVGIQVDHALRRWLIWTLRAGYGLDDYVSDPCTCNGGLARLDKRVSLGTAITYKLNREVSLKGEYRYDQMRSNVAKVDYNANVFLVGLKLQR